MVSATPAITSLVARVMRSITFFKLCFVEFVFFLYICASACGRQDIFYAKVFRVALNEIWEISREKATTIFTYVVWSSVVSFLPGFPRTSLRWCESAPHFLLFKAPPMESGGPNESNNEKIYYFNAHLFFGYFCFRSKFWFSKG